MAKYASVYARERSPFWWISYWCPRQQKRIHQSTTYRRDQVQGKRKALDLANEKSKVAGADKSEKGQDRWERWVEDFLLQRYPGENRKKTRVRMVTGWKQWREFLTDAGLRIPRALTYPNVPFKAQRDIRGRTGCSMRHAKKLVIHSTRPSAERVGQNMDNAKSTSPVQRDG